jgi:hypothetical protein
LPVEEEYWDLSFCYHEKPRFERLVFIKTLKMVMLLEYKENAMMCLFQTHNNIYRHGIIGLNQGKLSRSALSASEREYFFG